MAEQTSVDVEERNTIDRWFDEVRAVIAQVGGSPILFMHPNKYVYLLSYYERAQGSKRSVRLPGVPAGTEVVVDRLLPEDVFEVRGSTTVRVPCAARSPSAHGA